MKANKRTVRFLIGQGNVCVQSSLYGLWKSEDCFCLREVISSTTGPEGQHLYYDKLTCDTDNDVSVCVRLTVVYN